MVRELTRFLLVLLIGAVVFMQLPNLLPFVFVSSFSVALFASSVLASAFTLTRSYLPEIIKSPKTLEATLGALSFAIYSLLLEILGFALPGFYVHGKLAFICALIYIFITWVLSSLIIRFLDLFFEW
jgi:uncharacterized membrane protein YvlD (DUF360 family)